MYKPFGNEIKSFERKMQLDLKIKAAVKRAQDWNRMDIFCIIAGIYFLCPLNYYVNLTRMMWNDVADTGPCNDTGEIVAGKL